MQTRRPPTPPPPEPRATASPVSLRRRLLPGLLLALGLGVALVGWLGRRDPAAGPDATQRLRAAARHVAARDPVAWGGIELFSPQELAALKFPPVTAGTPVVIAPQGLVVDGRPRSRWGGVPLEATVELRLSTAAGTLCWARSGQGGVLNFPPEARELAPGLHELVVKLTPDGPTAKGNFEVAAPAQVARLAAATAAVNTYAPKDFQPLLRAHVALRLGFLLEAEACAQESLNADPKNATALGLLRYVHASLGETEGWQDAR